MEVISSWIKNPVTGFSKDNILIGRSYETEVEMLQDFCKLSRNGENFVLHNVTTKVTNTIDSIKIVEYNIVCATVYQETHKDCNQAEWTAVLVVAEAVND